VRASREIATSAGLGWWQPEKRPIQIIPTHGAPPFSRLKYFLGLEWVPSDNELLAANPNFAWLFLFHPSGYVREAALCYVDAPPESSFFFTALAWRLNDWAAPVRQAAEHCFKRIFGESLRPLPQMRHYICSNAGSFGVGGVTRQIFSI